LFVAQDLSRIRFVIFTPAGSAGTADALGRHAIGTLSLRLTFVSNEPPPSVTSQK
jgi:hypothetical protein